LRTDTLGRWPRVFLVAVNSSSTGVTSLPVSGCSNLAPAKGEKDVGEPGRFRTAGTGGVPAGREGHPGSGGLGPAALPAEFHHRWRPDPPAGSPRARSDRRGWTRRGRPVHRVDEGHLARAPGPADQRRLRDHVPRTGAADSEAGSVTRRSATRPRGGLRLRAVRGGPPARRARPRPAVRRRPDGRGTHRDRLRGRPRDGRRHAARVRAARVRHRGRPRGRGRDRGDRWWCRTRHPADQLGGPHRAHRDPQGERRGLHRGAAGTVPPRRVLPGWDHDEPARLGRATLAPRGHGLGGHSHRLGDPRGAAVGGAADLCLGVAQR